MFKIRSEQTRVFQPDAEETFVNRVADYLKENHADDWVRLPEAEMKISELPEASLREMVKTGIRSARRYGIEWKSNLIAFVTMMFISAPNFDESEKAAKILNDETILPEEKLDALTAQMIDDDWLWIERNYNQHKWNLTTEEQSV